MKIFAMLASLLLIIDRRTGEMQVFLSFLEEFCPCCLAIAGTPALLAPSIGRGIPAERRGLRSNGAMGKLIQKVRQLAQSVDYKLCRRARLWR